MDDKIEVNHNVKIKNFTTVSMRNLISYTPITQIINLNTFSNGCLGSHNDEERSEMRYVMRIALLRESSKL